MPTSWSIDNKTSIFVLAIIISLFGIMNYQSIPKEQIPDIVIPTIMVNTIYPGTAPTDMENLITRPIEKNIKSINGVKKITSNSVQDFSAIVIEFNTGVDVTDAKQKVKDAVDKTKKDLPNDLSKYGDPQVMDIDLSEIPIMAINLYGDYDLVKLKTYAEMAQDRIESFKEITRVDIIGALDREIQINVNMYKMQAASVTFADIERAIAAENLTISGGAIDIQGMRRSIRVVGEFENIEVIKNIAFHSASGALVRMQEIADVGDGFKEQESFAHLNGKNVITCNVIKKTGQNLLDASDKIKDVLDDLQKNKFPSNLKLSITGDQSKFTRTTLNELNNTIIIGFILVTIVLMFFMGLTNAIFVGLSVPLSMFICYIIMPSMGYTMNMLVMFSFIFALGIVVDDAIVVIENTHRIFIQNKGRLNVMQSAKFAAGEVFVPILSGTLTTLAPFFPLIFWPGTVGKFMHFIPVVIIITLLSSLFVAYIINPVFAVNFMKHDEENKYANNKPKLFKIGGAFIGLGILSHLIGFNGFGNFIFFIALFFVFHNIWGFKILRSFQHHFIPALMRKYESLLKWVLYRRRPYWIMVWMAGFFVVAIAFISMKGPKVVFFPAGEPMYIYTFVKLPVGTDQKVTDSITRLVEQKIINIVGKDNPDVESVTSNIALGASENNFDRSITSNKGKVTLSFVEYAKRTHTNTSAYMDSIRNGLKNFTGAEITVNQNQMGPPSAGKPVNIEITGDNIEDLIFTVNDFKKAIENKNIGGIEQLKSDFDQTKPEVVIDIDRQRANIEGITTYTVGMEIRTAILGKEISKYRELEDQYPIQLRYQEDIRNNLDRLMNLKIVYRDMNSGLLRQIPLSSVAKINYINSYGGIKRKNLKRVITISSNVLSGYNAVEINKQISGLIDQYKVKEGVDIKLTGEAEDMKESSQFLGKAMLLALFLIFFILITQFNSISKPLIIITEVIFSVVGVFIGFIIFGMDISIAMTGLGLVALAGIVVRNGILLVEFTDVLKQRGLKTRDAIIHGGKTRITPVLLTATATVLGLVPLAIGFNINFVTMFTDLNPHIHFGGDNMLFFGSLAWTIIFGLSFATVLTLVLIPIMYYIIYVSKFKSVRRKTRKAIINGEYHKDKLESSLENIEL